ncbi:vWA domain-containing protein [Cytobacillus massiliigabonensis]|uniref:vWA domain-containing protein n=1 Tax=Cytobacillus massiliigabonensis TaxID=1871011 RepID=UPI000C814DC2|nr:BatA and WFA domain-containing protein [Cytobacillus massiliigabonensis]
MQFLNPIYFTLSIFIAAVILFYFFRKQYVEKPISSNFLWKQVLNEWQASPWLKKLQQNLLFWLQLLALLFLLFSLVRPFWLEEAELGEHLILIADPSASMSAKYKGNTRFEEGKKEMLDLVDSLGGQEVTLIKAGEKPEILLSQETDHAVIRQQVSSLEMSYDHEQIEKAIHLAASLSSGKDTSVHIFSDEVTEKQVEHILEDQYVEVHNVGDHIENLSLASFGVSPVNDQATGIAVIENQSDKEKDVHFIVKSEEDVLFKQNISIQGNAQSVVQIPKLKEKPYYEGVITNEDGYTLDNISASIQTEMNPKVYTVGNVNSFAIKGFQTIGADLLQTNAEIMNDLAVSGIFVSEGSRLLELPKQPVLFFNKQGEKVKLTKEITTEEDSLLQYVDFEKVYIESAMTAPEGDWSTIVSSGDVPLIQKGKVNGQPIVIINFSLADSDWPLQPGFPIFLYNTFQWLSQQTTFLGYFGPGEEKWLNTSEDGQSWEIFNDEDENLYSLNLKKESFRAPIYPGTYQAVSGEYVYYFSVLLDDREKHANTEPSFVINENKLQADGQHERANDQLWFWLALIAFVLIVLEWEVYRRGYRV